MIEIEFLECLVTKYEKQAVGINNIESKAKAMSMCILN